MTHWTEERPDIGRIHAVPCEARWKVLIVGLMRMAARTAVVAGTATAVSGRVAHRQQEKWQEQAYEQQAQQQYAAAAQPTYAAPAPASTDMTAQLQQLAQLHTQGILTDEEFAAKKAQILGI